MHRTDVLMKSCNGSPPEAWGLRSSHLPGLSITSQLATGLDPQTGSETMWLLWTLGFYSGASVLFATGTCLLLLFEILYLAELISDIPMKQSFPYSATLHHLASQNRCISIELPHTYPHTTHASVSHLWCRTDDEALIFFPRQRCLSFT